LLRRERIHDLSLSGRLPFYRGYRLNGWAGTLRGRGQKSRDGLDSAVDRSPNYSRAATTRS
jgi:hypothetical protein